MKEKSSLSKEIKTKAKHKNETAHTAIDDIKYPLGKMPKILKTIPNSDTLSKNISGIIILSFFLNNF